MKKPCANCPFLRKNEWRGGWIMSKVSAMETIEESGNIFSCHEKHPDRHVFSNKPMIHNDCAGFAQMQKNMKKANTYPEVANNILETHPTGWNFKGYFISEGISLKLLEGL